MDNKETKSFPRLYTDLAKWFHLLTAPEDYVDEAEFFHQTLLEISEVMPESMLELGSGGGNNASLLKNHYHLTLVDISEQMLEISRQLNPECEHILGGFTLKSRAHHGCAPI
jgi:ubiquinone/menaquinone biosynthesis C-methylase UbiE